MSETTDLQVSCHCGSTTHTFTIPTNLLPLPAHLCNCNISRRISGTLLTSYVNITFDTGAYRPDTWSCTQYRSSDVLTRYFCATCGTHMYLEYHDDGHFEAATGTLRRVGKETEGKGTDGVVEFKSQMWIGDTKDGGASQFLTHINDKQLPRYLQNPDPSATVPLDWNAKSLPKTASQPPSPSPSKEGKDAVHAHCHCTGVTFYITPPDSSSYTPTSGFPDLFIPFGQAPPDIDISNPENSPWWIQSNGTRFLAGTCTCHSCRLSLGFDITTWAFIPPSNIFLDAALTQPFSRNGDRYWGTMKSYSSSANVTRTFCSVCGANVFWDGRPGRHEQDNNVLVDVAVGLLDAESGARAEELLAWWPGRVSFGEEAVNKGLLEGLERGLKDWAGRNEGKDCVAKGENALV